MIEHDEGIIKYLTFGSLDDLGLVRNIFTTRLGGVSTGYYSSMNLAYTNGDDEENVDDNYKIIAPVIGTDTGHIIRSHQTHTTNVQRVDESMILDDGERPPRPFLDTDGLVTDVPGIALATFYADCVPLYFVDPVKKAIGLSHSGWRGTAAGMALSTVNKMKTEFGSDPDDIYAAIGPSICKDHYEVSEAVAHAFRNAFGDDIHSVLYPGKESGKYQLDLWEANRIMMIRSGIREDRIEVSGLCTYENPELLFSHRASMGKRGNMAAFLMLI